MFYFPVVLCVNFVLCVKFPNVVLCVNTIVKFTPSFAGQLNYLGSSHQWWHLMVVLAFAWTHHMTRLVFLFWHSNHCPSTTQPLPDQNQLALDTIALTEDSLTS